MIPAGENRLPTQTGRRQAGPGAMSSQEAHKRLVPLGTSLPIDGPPNRRMLGRGERWSSTLTLVLGAGKTQVFFLPPLGHWVAMWV